MRERKVEVIKGARVASYDGLVVTLSDGTSVPAQTLIWTAGVKPSPVIDSLPCQKVLCLIQKPESFIRPPRSTVCGKPVVAAKNIEAAILGRPLRPFVFTILGQLATIGRRTGVAMVFGIKFSGFVAWFLWRTVYLMKLPRLAKKLRVMVSWILDLFFAREIEQMITLHDVEALSGLLGRIRARAKQARSTNAASVLTNSGHDQP